MTLISVTNKAVIKLADKHDYWKPFDYKNRRFVKTFQGVKEVKPSIAKYLTGNTEEFKQWLSWL